MATLNNKEFNSTVEKLEKMADGTKLHSAENMFSVYNNRSRVKNKYKITAFVPEMPSLSIPTGGETQPELNLIPMRKLLKIQIQNIQILQPSFMVFMERKTRLLQILGWNHIRRAV